LIEKFLLHVQRENNHAVNEALNDLYVKSENYKALRQSIDSYHNFDQVAIALKLEHHELIEFRRISAFLYRLNKRYERSMELSKTDSLWGDAMETAAESKNRELCEELLQFFVESKQKECFAACLFTCFELLRPDVVLELAWRNQLMNFAMPFMIQTMHEFDYKLNFLYSKLDDKEKAENDAKDKEKKEEDAKIAHVQASQLNSNVFLQQPMLPMLPPGYSQQPMMAMHGGYSQALVPIGMPMQHNPYAAHHPMF